MTSESFRKACKYQVTVYPDESCQKIRITVRNQQDMFETESICNSITPISVAIYYAVSDHQVKKVKEENPFALYKSIIHHEPS